MELNNQENRLRTLVAIKLMQDGHLSKDDVAKIGDDVQQNIKQLQQQESVVNSIESCDYEQLVEVMRQSGIDMSIEQLDARASSGDDSILSAKVNSILAEKRRSSNV